MKRICTSCKMKITAQLIISFVFAFLAHLSPNLARLAYRMVLEPASFCPCIRAFTFSKIFSETTWRIKAKFYMKHLLEEGTNVYINNPDHMTKKAAMPINGINQFSHDIFDPELSLYKPFKNLRNRWTNFNKTWYVALMTKEL